LEWVIGNQTIKALGFQSHDECNVARICVYDASDLIGHCGRFCAGWNGCASQAVGGVERARIDDFMGSVFFHAIITFVAYAGASRSLGFLKANRPGLQFFRALALFAATTSFYIAITRMPLGVAASIQFLAPVLVTAFSGLFLGEKVGPRRWSAVVCAFVGVLIVVRPGSGIFGWWALLPLVTAFLLATYMIMTRTIRDKDRPDVTTFYTTAVGAVVLTFIMPVVWAPLSPTGWALMIGMGVAGAIGHYCLVRAFHAEEASALAPFTYAHVVAAIIYSFVIFKDVPSIWTLTGAALIVGSGIYVWYRETMIARTARRP